MAQPGFTKNEVKRMVEIAKRDGLRVEMERNGVVFRVGPATDDSPKSEQKSEHDALILM
jgi:hypothetical protein